MKHGVSFVQKPQTSKPPWRTANTNQPRCPNMLLNRETNTSIYEGKKKEKKRNNLKMQCTSTVQPLIVPTFYNILFSYKNNSCFESRLKIKNKGPADTTNKLPHQKRPGISKSRKTLTLCFINREVPNNPSFATIAPYTSHKQVPYLLRIPVRNLQFIRAARLQTTVFGRNLAAPYIDCGGVH